MCALICTSPGSPIGRDVEASKALDKRLAYLVAKNRFAQMGRLPYQDSATQGRPRTSSVSSEKQVHPEPVPGCPDDKPSDGQAILCSIPKQPHALKKCGIVRIELPKVVAARSPSDQCGQEYTKVINRSMEVFKL